MGSYDYTENNSEYKETNLKQSQQGTILTISSTTWCSIGENEVFVKVRLCCFVYIASVLFCFVCSRQKVLEGPGMAAGAWATRRTYIVLVSIGEKFKIRVLTKQYRQDSASRSNIRCPGLEPMLLIKSSFVHEFKVCVSSLSRETSMIGALNSVGSKTTIAVILTQIICQIAIFIGIWYHFQQNKEFRCVCKKFKEPFPLAKSSAALISFNLSLLILFSSKFFLRFFWIPISRSQSLHYTLSFFILLWSIVHTIAHYLNFNKLKNPPYFSWGVGYTGILLWIILLLILSVSATRIRQSYFHKFVYYHSILFIFLIVFLFIHQSFCFIKTDYGKCPLPLSWIFVTPSLLLFLTEFIWKYADTRYHVRVDRVVKHEGVSNDIIEVVLPLNSSFAGKTIWLCCPTVSYFEWHPFAVSHTNEGIDNGCSIHFKTRGNWTTKFAKVLGVENNGVFPVILPKVIIQGPFHCYPKHILENIASANSIIITNGIGVTTFSYLFTQLNNLSSFNNSLSVMIIVKDSTEIDWLLPLLHSLVSKFQTITINIALTQSKLSPPELSAFSVILGRPNFTKFMHAHYISHALSSNDTQFLPRKPFHSTNVYFSGTSSLFSDICRSSRQYKSYYKFFRF